MTRYWHEMSTTEFWVRRVLAALYMILAYVAVADFLVGVWKHSIDQMASGILARIIVWLAYWIGLKIHGDA